MTRYVWMFLVKVEALSNQEMLKAGSEAQIQVCIPGEHLEPSLEVLSSHLAAEHYKRMDLSIARRFDLEDDTEEFPAEYLERELRKAGLSGAPVTACTFTSKESASWREEVH